MKVFCILSIYICLHYSLGGNSKFDIVRNVEVINYTSTSDRSSFETSDESKEIKKEAFIPFRTSFIHGHRFEQHHKPTWCDVCEDFIWGLYTQAVRCQCKYMFYLCFAVIICHVFKILVLNT